MSVAAARFPSERQDVLLAQDERNGPTLLLDGALQFTARWEHRYHESLALVPLLFASAPRRVFVGGGGDGLAVARLLRFPEVEHVILCDHDPTVTTLAREDADLRALNGDSLRDPRVALVHDDARAWLEAHDEVFDIVLCDFPLPRTLALAPLYGVPWYRLVAHRLAPGGVLATLTPPRTGPRERVVAALSEVFAAVRYYRTVYPEGGVDGFTLAAAEPLERRRAVPPWARYLDERVVDALFHLPADERLEPLPSPGPDADGALYRAMADAWLRDRTAAIHYNATWRELALGAAPPGSEARLAPGLLEGTPERLMVTVDATAAGSWAPRLEACGYRLAGHFERMLLRFEPGDLERRAAWWARLDDGRLCQVDARFCRAAEEPEVARLLGEYLDRHPEQVVVPVDRAHLFSRRRLYLLARDPRGEAMALAVVEPYGERHLWETLYGPGSSRLNMLATLLFLQYLAVEVRTEVVLFASSRNVAGFSAAFGATSLGAFEVWLPTGADGARRPLS